MKPSEAQKPAHTQEGPLALHYGYVGKLFQPLELDYPEASKKEEVHSSPNPCGPCDETEPVKKEGQE
ncbi:hypothetical protein DPEC_G00308620 [Dallia pectoralis]|uniref:Uncharacterized protein n=1 Tax=Dallia pectoralis TaxID=75939 RepID=A0ACC2FEQ4_DALPE|nr:hypothetical protein DPEC_G00308620 [Dallia pectoralis]